MRRLIVSLAEIQSVSLTPAPHSKHAASPDDDRLACTLTGPVIVQNHAVRPKALATPAAAPEGCVKLLLD